MLSLNRLVLSSRIVPPRPLLLILNHPCFPVGVARHHGTMEGLARARAHRDREHMRETRDSHPAGAHTEDPTRLPDDGAGGGTRPILTILT